MFGAWDGCAETVAMVAGAWALFARLGHVRGLTGDTGLRIARVLYALVMVPFGIAHLLYVDDTAGLVPDYIPMHVAWVYITAIAFFAAGVAIVSGVFARLAAALSAAQIGGFTLLVWLPMILRGSPNAFQWSEFGISCALTAAAWAIADSYRRA